MNENQKVAVKHVLSAIKPKPLKERLESDVAFSQHALRKEFTGFLAHAIKLAEVFRLVYYDPPSNCRHREDGKRSGNNKDNEPAPSTKPTQMTKPNLNRNNSNERKKENLVPLFI